MRNGMRVIAPETYLMTHDEARIRKEQRLTPSKIIGENAGQSSTKDTDSVEDLRGLAVSCFVGGTKAEKRVDQRKSFQKSRVAHEELG